MFFSRKQNCPNCGAENPADASFCKSCAKPLGSGTIKCGACGTTNPGDALYCMNCSQELESSQAARIASNRWVITENDFAVRIDTEDLPGLLKKGILVEPGTNGMLIEDGANVGVVPPGSYMLDSFSQRFGNLFRSGLPKRITALLVQITPTDLDFPITGLFSKDPLPVNMTVKLQVEVQEPAKFLINMLRGRERLTNNVLREHLFPEIEAVASQWVRSHTVEELAEDFSLRPKFELALEEA
jgi:ribosomal protein L40E